MVIKLISTFSLLAICMFSATASAEETSTNAELQQMIMDLIAKQERLEQELIEVRSEATDAKQERAVTREEVAETQTAAVMRPQNTDSGPYANLDFMYKRQVHDRLTYAQFGYSSTDDNTNQTSWKYDAVDIKTEYEPGFRIGLGYLSSRGAEAFANFSYLATSFDSSVTEPVTGQYPENFLFPKFLPAEALNFNPVDTISSASASYDMDYRVLDAGFAQNLDIGEQLNLRFGGGLRYASIDDNLSANYTKIYLFPSNDPQIPDEPSETEIIGAEIKNDFWGVGPRATVDATWHIPNTSGLSIFGGLGASILYGENEFSYLGQGLGPENNNRHSISFTNVEKHLYPVVEANVGAGYSASFDAMSYDFRIGYEFETWFDALSRQDFTDIATQSVTREDTDLSLHGLFFRGNIKW